MGIAKNKNKFVVDDDDEVINITSIKAKNIKSMTKAETDTLLQALAQLAGISDSTGKVKDKNKPPKTNKP